MPVIRRYTASDASRWDKFVEKSKNATFLFKRGYMDYHADRFSDNSLIVTDDEGEWLTVLPANLTGDGQLVSHGGLTYGGFVMTPDTKAHEPLLWFELLKNYCRQNHINEIVYKPVPYIYHTLPAQEDIYALFRNQAQMTVCNLASVVKLPDAIASRLGKRALKRSKRYGITVESTTNASDFWQIIVDDRRLQHNTVPVHSLQEMQLLRDRFPDNIRFFIAKKDGETVAGAVVYIMPESGVIHLQYAASTLSAREIYAVDAIYHYLVFDIYPNYRYFDFGTSNEKQGQYLNTRMTAHKEEFGARSVVYETFTIRL